MNNALSVSPALETKWTVVSGAMKGSVRLMHAPMFTIGRSPECEFVIVNDPKCSRRHAQVQWTEAGCEITGLNEANPVMINGREIKRNTITDGDIITLGDTEVQFNLTTLPTEMSRQNMHPALVDPRAANYAAAHEPKRRSKSARRRPKKNNTTFMVICTALVIFGLWIATASTAKKKAELALRGEKESQADLDTANKLNEAAQNLPIKRFETSGPAFQAQENFVRGFRDYRKGQFERSIGSFQACLALDPSHALCTRYMRLAQRRFSELVQYNVVLGRRYRDQNQFKSCRAAFRNVMAMVQDLNSPVYKEAKANYDACNSMIEGRY
jgi:pSer/pThr/pTyr-binding forkhead associated (FHA) protein